MSESVQITREKLMQFSKAELVEELLGALAVVVSLKKSPEEGETMLKIIQSQAQQITDGRTIYDAAHRENNRLRAALMECKQGAEYSDELGDIIDKALSLSSTNCGTDK